jgi:hypothetical protein
MFTEEHNYSWQISRKHFAPIKEFSSPFGVLANRAKPIAYWKNTFANDPLWDVIHLVNGSA